MMFKVIGTETYLKEIEKFPKDEQEIADKLSRRLAVNPYSGDHLSYPFLREKRIREKRVYYLVYDDLGLVLLVATSGKKDQQKTIDHIKRNLDQFKDLAQEISKQAF